MLRKAYEVLVALALACWVELRVRRTPLPHLAKQMGVVLLDTTGAANQTLVVTPNEALRLRAVTWVYDHWPRDESCLRRALVAGQRLRHRQPGIRLGVRRDPQGAFKAHAWLEIDGVCWEAEALSYATLSSGPATGADADK